MGLVQTAIVKVAGVLDPSVAKTIDQASKKCSGLKVAVAAATAAFASAGAAAVVFGKEALQSASVFETGMSKVSTLLEGTPEAVSARIAEMGNSVMDIARKTGMATDDLSDGMYNIVSALGDSKDVASQVEVAAMAAKAGGATTNDAINLLSAVTKGYGDTSGEAWQTVSDLAFTTLKLGQTSFPELAASMGKVVPIASAMNITQKELFGSFATLTGVTGSTAEVATQLKAVFSGLMSPSKAMSDVISQLGYESAGAMLKQKGWVGTLDELTKACGDDKMAVAKLFSSVEAQTAILALAGEQTQSFVEKTEAMGKVTNATNNAFDKSTDNLEGRLAKMNQVFETFKIKMGQILIPIVSNVVDEFVPKLTESFEKIAPKIEEIFKTIAPILASFADKLPAVIEGVTGVAGMLFGGIKAGMPLLQFMAEHLKAIAIGYALVKGAMMAYTAVQKIKAVWDMKDVAVQKAKDLWAKRSIVTMGLQKGAMIASAVATKAVAAAQWLLNAAMHANPIGLIIAGVALLAAGFVLLYKKCEPFRNFINGIGSAIKKGFLAAVEWFKALPEKLGAVFSTIGEFFKNNWKLILLALVNPIGAIFKVLYDKCEGFRNIVDKVCGFFKSSFLAAVEWFKAIPEKIGAIFSTVGGFFKGIFESVRNMIAQNVQASIQTYKNLWESIKAVFSVVGEFFKGIFEGVRNAVVQHIQSSVQNFKAMWESIKAVFAVVREFFGGIFESVRNAVVQHIQASVQNFRTMWESIKLVFSTVGEFFGGIFENVKLKISGFCEGAKGIFNGLCDAVKNIASTIGGFFKGAINSAISGVNGLIGKVNKALSFTVPDWVPGLGGKSFSLNIPNIPMLATGGIATSPAICGEGGYPEYVITTDPKYRAQNIDLLAKAAGSLGAVGSDVAKGRGVLDTVKRFSNAEGGKRAEGGSESRVYKIEFSPVINIHGSPSNAQSIADEVMRVFDDYAPELADKIKMVLATAKEGSY